MDRPIDAIVLGGAAMMVSGILMLFVKDNATGDK